jgi:hypothetical protein
MKDAPIALAAVLRGWTWRDTALGLLLGLVCLVYMGGPLLPGALDHRDWGAPLVYNVLQFGLPIVLAVRLADVATERGTAPRLAYGLAVLLVVTVGVWVVGPALMPLLGSEPGWTVVNDLWLAVGIGTLLGVGVAGYARWRAAGLAEVQRLAAESREAQRAQALESARLLALQARVEPQLLFDVLSRVRALLDRDDDTAGQLLAELIALLRALLPRSDATGSSLARELALVASYGGVAGQPALLPPRLQVAVPPDAADADFAPSLLLDLLRALACSGGARWLLAAVRDGTRLRLTLSGTPAERAAAAIAALDLPAFAARLRAVHGSGALLQQDGCAAPALVIDIAFKPHDDRVDR